MNEAMPILIVCGCASALGIMMSTLTSLHSAKTMKKTGRKASSRTDKKEFRVPKEESDRT